MNEEELRKLMQSGFEKLRPHIVSYENILL